jgi:hypothetical protein
MTNDNPSSFWPKQRIIPAEDEHTDWDGQEGDMEIEELAVNRELGRVEMSDWFHQNFEEPTHWDSEDKEYIFPFGGPFEAADVLFSEFGSRFPEEHIISLVDELEGDGTTLWQPKSTGDFFDSDDLSDDEQQSSVQLRESILANLTQLKALIDKTPAIPAQVGHNNPPEEFGLPPYNAEEIHKIKTIVDSTLTVLNSEDINAGEILRESEKIDNWTEKFLPWLAKKGDLIVDEVIKEGVKVGFQIIKISSIIALCTKIAKELSIYANLLAG